MDSHLREKYYRDRLNLTQFRFDITSKKPQHHYGLKAAEKDEVAERGYLLREIEPRSRFLDDNDDSSDQDYKLADE